jgi:aryl-phospho-beta-D-glucosidase BglC (GH1 family)
MKETKEMENKREIKKFIIKILLILSFSFFVLNINNTTLATGLSESELSATLNSKSTWIKGYYESWGAAYKESSSYCTENPIYIDPGTYYIAINDSRIKLSIHQFKEDGSWIHNYTGGLVDGSTITIDDSAAYIKINLASSKWGMDPYEYFDYGLTINMLKEYQAMTLEKVDLATADLTDVSKIKSGLIVEDTVRPGINLQEVYIDNLFYPDDTKYVINLPNPYLRMNIIEFDENNSAILSSTLAPGATWQRQENTSYIAINITNLSKNPETYNYDDYIALFSNYDTALLTKYTKYVHNTEFDTTFTAYDFAQTMNIGWNLGDSLESSYCENTGEDLNLKIETSWGNPYVTKDLIDYVASLGFNTIRIPVTWYPNSNLDDDGHYTIGQEWFSRVQDVVDFAIQNDMYVIINTMYDEDKVFYVGVEDETTWAEILQHGTEMWTQIAEYFKDYDEHLIFESYNEVGTSSGWAYSSLATSQINELNQVFTDAVRKTGGNNKYRLLMVPTYTTSPKDNVTGDFVLPTDEIDGRIMVSVHVYDSMYDEDLEWRMESLEQFSISINAPIIIGEFGMNTKSKIQEVRAIHMSNYLARATEHGIKCIVWDDNYTWQLVDRWNYSNTKTNLIKAMFDGYNNGIAYKTVKNKVSYTSINQFFFSGFSLSKGEAYAVDYSSYWYGGLLLLNEDRTSIKIEIPDNTDYLGVHIKTANEASEVWIVGVTWYDEDGNVLSYKTSQSISTRYTAIDIPEGAKYYTASFNDPYKNRTVAVYQRWLNEETIYVTVTYVNTDDLGVAKEIVNVKNYNYYNRTLSEITETKVRENLDDCDLNNVYNWVSGSYKSETGAYVTGANKLALKEYKTVEPGTQYNIKIKGEGYYMQISELDENFNVIGSKKILYNGDTYTVSNHVQYVALYIGNSTSMVYSDYATAFADKTLVISLKDDLEDNSGTTDSGNGTDKDNTTNTGNETDKNNTTNTGSETDKNNTTNSGGGTNTDNTTNTGSGTNTDNSTNTGSGTDTDNTTNTGSGTDTDNTTNTDNGTNTDNTTNTSNGNITDTTVSDNTLPYTGENIKLKMIIALIIVLLIIFFITKRNMFKKDK